MTSLIAENNSHFEAAVSPQGRIHIKWDHGDQNLDTVAIPKNTAIQISDAFQSGNAHGLLHLAGALLSIELPASLNFGGIFLDK